MKKLSIIACSLLLTFAGQAQKDSLKKKIEIQIQENTMKIESSDFENLSQLDLSRMIAEATQSMMQIQRQNEKTLAQIKRLEANDEISAEEAEEMREKTRQRTAESMEAIARIMETWGEDYDNKMDAWATEYESKMKNWEKKAQQATKAGEAVPPMPPLPAVPMAPGAASADTASGKSNRIILRKDGVVIENEDGEDDVITWDYKGNDDDDEESEDEFFDDDFFKDPAKTSKKISRTEGYLDLHFGWNVQLEEGQYLIEDVPGEQNIWKSTSFVLGAGAKSRIGSPYSKFYIKYGGEISWHNFRLSGNEMLSRNDQNSFYAPMDSAHGLEKNKYHVAYINVPIMFQLDLSEPGEMDENWTFGLGGYGGVRINAKRELEYSTRHYREIEEKAYTDFYTSSIRYGLMAQLGYEAFKITVTYDLNPFFRNNRGPGPYDYNMLNVTLGFTI